MLSLCVFSFFLTAPQEQQFYSSLFSLIDTSNIGRITGDASFTFLLSSGLPQRTLGEIWALVDPSNTGYLSKEAWWGACRLIGHGQAQLGAGKGEGKEPKVDETMLNRFGGWPRFEGYPAPPLFPPPFQSGNPPVTPSRMGTLSPQGTGTAPHPALSNTNTGTNTGPLPPLTSSDLTQFTRLFSSLSPSPKGTISGPQAQSIFLKSRLPVETLADVWNLADTQQRGELDLPDFVVGMWLIQGLMSGKIGRVPEKVPEGIYEMASGGRKAMPGRQMTDSAFPPGGAMQMQMQPQLTGQSVSSSAGGAGFTGGIRHQSPVSMNAQLSQPSRQFSTPIGAGAGSGSRSNFSPFPPPLPAAPQPPFQLPWSILPSEKSISDSYFQTLDPSNRGFIEGDVAVPFMIQSGLEEGTLAQIWDLADIRKEGKLTKEEFAVALRLINDKLAGKEVPSVLDVGLVPPALREIAAKNASGGQGQQQQSQIEKDLFDVFADSPPSAKTSNQQQQQQQSYFPAGVSQSPPAQTPTPGSRALSPASHQASVAAVAAGGVHTPSSSTFGHIQQQQQQPDSFGMSPFGSGGFGAFSTGTKTPINDLMGDDEPVTTPTATATARGGSQHTATVLPDESTEIKNKTNEIENTNKSIEGLKEQRQTLESQITSGSAQIRELELRLSSVKAQHQTESRLVSDLLARTSDQKSILEKLRSELIQNESELSALRAEKDEIEQQLLTDKEEVRNIGKRMKDVNEETETMKSLLEKMKKEAKKQRGMVVISKKQVATAEMVKEDVQKEMDQVAAGSLDQDNNDHEDILADDREFQEPIRSATLATAASIPLPTTPQRVISPTLTGGTGTANKSNNPFERMAIQRAPPPPPPTTHPSSRSNSQPEAVPAPTKQDEKTEAQAEADGIIADEPYLTSLQKATLGAGGVAAVGGLGVAGIAGAAVVGAGTALAVGAEKIVNYMQDGGKASAADENAEDENAEEKAEDEKADEKAEDEKAEEKAEATETRVVHPSETEHDHESVSENESDESVLEPIRKDDDQDLTPIPTSKERDLDPFGAPAGATAHETESALQEPAAVSTAQDDPFGMPSFEKGAASAPASSTDADAHDGADVASPEHPVQEPASSVATDSDPFGMPSFEKQAAPAAVATAITATPPTIPEPSAFDSSFGDSFGDGLSPSEPSAEVAQPQHPTANDAFGDNFGSRPTPRGVDDNEVVQTSPGHTPTAQMHLAPATEPENDFDQAFEDFDNQSPASAVPSAFRARDGFERTLSTQVLPPSSVHTPMTEVPPSHTPSIVEDEEQREVAPVEVPGQVEAMVGAPAAHHAADTDDSSDEEEGPEDLEKDVKSPFGGKAAAHDKELSVPHNQSLSTSEKGYDSFPPLQTLSLGPALSEPESAIQESQTDATTSREIPHLNNNQSGPPTAPAEPIPTSPAAHDKHRREPPPPPPRSSQTSPATTHPSTNPFATFAKIGDEQVNAPKVQGPSSSSSGFDDDDFDFENLPSVNVASVPAPTAAATQTQATDTFTRNDFEDDFDDFSPDFEMVSAPSPANVPASHQDAGEVLTNPQQPTKDLSFEDAFMSEFKAE